VIDIEYNGPFSLLDTISLYKPTEVCKCGSCDHTRIVDEKYKMVRWECSECRYSTIWYAYSDNTYLIGIAKKTNDTP
jgi:ribosomal protein L37AE/L43A